MFTMSLGGSSVKLETGKQVGTKTRQKPLEIQEKCHIFVTFTEKTCQVRIDGLPRNTLVTEYATKSLWDTLYVGVQAYRSGNGQIQKLEKSSHKMGYFLIALQKVFKNKNTYEFSKQELYNSFMYRQGVSTDIDIWKKAYSLGGGNGQQAGLDHNPPYFKVKFVLMQDVSDIKSLTPQFVLNGVNSVQTGPGRRFIIKLRSNEKYITISE